MSQERSVFVAFLLSLGVLILWRAFLVKTPPPPKTPATVAAKPAAGTPAPSTASPAAGTQSATKSKGQPVTVPVRKAETPRQVVVGGPDYRVTLSNRGAVVTSWVLEKYKNENEEPLDLIDQNACGSLGFPLGLRLEDSSLAGQLNSALYVVEAPGDTLTVPARVGFVYSDGATVVRKEFSFGPNYQVHVEVSVSQGGRALPVEVAWSGGFGDPSLPPKIRDATTMAVYGSPGDFTTIAEKKIKETRSVGETFAVAGLEDHYFVGVFLPESPGSVFRLDRRSWSPEGWTEKELPSPLEASLGTAEAKPLDFRLLVAPKDLDLLHSFNPRLDGLVNFGWFSVVAKPLFLGLRLIREHWVHNWGWAIVILTLIISLATFPLKLKSIRSAQEMQKVQPIIKGIQDKYKQYKLNDPRKQKMNEEVMKVYKEHGVNPLGGCLPMLLMMPPLYAIYEVLGTAIEMRHAPWIGCIRDLAMPDKCYLFGIHLAVLPTVMIVTMFVLQKMTPMATADPAQRRMMMITPLIFGIMFYNFASGLVLYWLTSNVAGIGQQLVINKWWPVKPLSPPASSPPPGRKAAQREAVQAK